MKILKVEISNINSLYSGDEAPVVIDFESELFKDVGIFAITGSTGAGKTTILDAITIALYNKVPRFESTKAKLTDVVSHGARMASSRVSFRIDGVDYQAYWALELRKKNGDFYSNPKETVQLIRLDTREILASAKKTEYLARIHQITKLSYKQFLRSVLLAQGQFAAFLSAPNKEKGELLEQMTGQDIFKRIGETLLVRKAEEAEKLKELEQEINKDDILSPEQVQELELEKENIRKSRKLIDEQLKNCSALLSWYSNEQKLSNDKQLLVKWKEDLNTFKEQNAASQQKLLKHRKTEVFEDVLREIRRLTAQDAALRSEQNKLEIDAKSIDIASEAKKNEQLKAAAQQAEDEVEKWAPSLDKVTKLDSELELSNKSLGEKQSELKEIAESAKEDDAKLGQVKDAIRKVGKELDRANQKLKENVHLEVLVEKLSDWISMLNMRKDLSTQVQESELSKQKLSTEIDKIKPELARISKDIDEKEPQQVAQKKRLDAYSLVGADLSILNKRKDKLSQHQNKLRELVQLASSYEKQASIIKEEQAKLKNFADLQGKLAAELKLNEDAQNKQADLIESQTKLIALQQKVKELEAERANLQENKACPLCGSTEHPYVSSYNPAQLDAESQKLDRLKRELSAFLAEEKSMKEELAIAKTKQNYSQQQLDYAQAQQKADEQVFSAKTDAALSAGIAGQLKQESSRVAQALDVLAQRLTAKQTVQAQQQKEQREYDKLSNQLSELKQQQASYKASLDSKETQLTNTTTKFEQLQSRLAALENELGTELAKAKQTACKADETENYIASLKHLALSYTNTQKTAADNELEQKRMGVEAQNIKKGIDSKQEQQKKLSLRLDDIKLLISQTSAKRAELLPVDMSPSEKREQLNQQHRAAKLKHEQSSQSLQSLKILLQENENLIAKAKKDIAENAKQLDNANKQLLADITKSSFANIEELKAARLSADKKDEYERIEQQLSENSIAIRTAEEKLAADNELLEQEKAKLVCSYIKEDAETEKSRLEQEKDELLTKAGAIAERLNKNEDINRRNAAKRVEIEKQAAVSDRYEGLYKLLGGSKDAFNTYVQRLTLKNLIDLANVHLSRLNERYSLLLPPNYEPHEELSFKLIDHYQTDQVRLVDTSSGGERFIISMALALGLSDMASRNVNIESLFIDEGFGSLDSKSLETVIGTLSALQATGKKIGVISHVDSMKERIGTQIRIEKRQNGMSKVSIVG